MKQTGIGRYVENMVSQLLHINSGHQFVLLIRPQDRTKLTFSTKGVEIIETDIPWYTPQEQIALLKILNDVNPDLVHFTNFNIPLNYRKPFVVDVHDLTMLHHKVMRGGLIAPFTYRLKDVVMRHVLKTAINRSKVVFTPTQYVRSEVAKRYRVSEDKIVITGSAADRMQAKGKVNLKKFGITKPYLLFVGNAYPHKNLERLIRAIEVLGKDESYKGQLVIAGKQDDFHRRLEKLSKKLKLDEQVRFTDWVSEAELAGLYEQATLYLFPSLSEGFGIPGLEAMAYDLPVLSSNATCLPEVYGAAAEYFDPLKVEEMAATIKRVLENPKRQQELIKAGRQRLKLYTWEQSAERVLKGYTQALMSESKKSKNNN